MAHYTKLTAAELAEAAAAFDLPRPERVEPEPKGRVNTGFHLWAGGDRWFLRLSEGRAEPDLDFEAEVLRFLFDARFPVPRLVPARGGRPFAMVAGRPASLFHYAPGEEVGRDQATPDRCRRIGEQLGRLHELAAGFTRERTNPFGPATVQGWLEALGDGGGDQELMAALPVFREEAALAAGLPGAPAGLIHADLFRDNVLWLGDRVGYLLDWEMACRDAFALDLAIAVEAWCYTDRHEPARAAALLQGYRGRRRLDPDTAAALWPFARFATLRFALGRVRTFRGGRPEAATVAFRDWRRYRDRLLALRALGAAGYRALLGL